MKFQHFLNIVIIYYDRILLLIIVLRNREAGTDIYCVAVDCALENTYYYLLVLRFPEVVIEDIWSDVGMYNTLDLFD